MEIVGKLNLMKSYYFKRIGWKLEFTFKPFFTPMRQTEVTVTSLGGEGENIHRSLAFIFHLKAPAMEIRCKYFVHVCHLPKTFPFLN